LEKYIREETLLIFKNDIQNVKFLYKYELCKIIELCYQKSFIEILKENSDKLLRKNRINFIKFLEKYLKNLVIKETLYNGIKIREKQDSTSIFINQNWIKDTSKIGIEQKRKKIIEIFKEILKLKNSRSDVFVIKENDSNFFIEVSLEEIENFVYPNIGTVIIFHIQDDTTNNIDQSMCDNLLNLAIENRKTFTIYTEIEVSLLETIYEKKINLIIEDMLNK
jgi:hypothetical protein